MEEYIFSNELLWWISVFDIPVFFLICGFIWKSNMAIQERIQNFSELLNNHRTYNDQSLLNFKLEVSRKYAESLQVKEIENRVIAHLLRIEKKLDVTALKTEALNAYKNYNFRKGDSHEK